MIKRRRISISFDVLKNKTGNEIRKMEREIGIGPKDRVEFLLKNRIKR